jgi:raffinose/stachyose/melibiose transport system permease protein
MRQKKEDNLIIPTVDTVASIFVFLIFGTPFYFMLLNSLKNRREAGLMNLDVPEKFIFENYIQVIEANNYMIIRGFINSVLITAGSILILLVICSMGGYILQRVRSRMMNGISFFLLTGLMLPPAILPTIWILNGLGIYPTIFGMVLIEAALNIPFCTMLYRGYTATIPKEMEEAAYIDGCTSINMFTRIMFPLFKPVTATIIALSAVTIFNDFVNPLYFLPGTRNPTVQLTLYNFIGRYTTSFNLLFACVILITIPPLLMFIFFNKRIVSGITAGAIKG